MDLLCVVWCARGVLVARRTMMLEEGSVLWQVTKNCPRVLEIVLRVPSASYKLQEGISHAAYLL